MIGDVTLVGIEAISRKNVSIPHMNLDFCSLQVPCNASPDTNRTTCN